MLPAKRDNSGKLPLDRVFLFKLEFLVAHMMAGEAKYPDDEETGLPNWLKGGKPDDEYLGAITRHLAAIRRGELYDPELGTRHDAAIAWNALAMLTCNYPDAPYRLTGGDAAGRVSSPDNNLSTPERGRLWRFSHSEFDGTGKWVYSKLKCNYDQERPCALYNGAIPVQRTNHLKWQGDAFCFHHLREEGLIL